MKRSRNERNPTQSQNDRLRGDYVEENAEYGRQDDKGGELPHPARHQATPHQRKSGYHHPKVPYSQYGKKGDGSLHGNVESGAEQGEERNFTGAKREYAQQKLVSAAHFQGSPESLPVPVFHSGKTGP